MRRLQELQAAVPVEDRETAALVTPCELWSSRADLAFQRLSRSLEDEVGSFDQISTGECQVLAVRAGQADLAGEGCRRRGAICVGTWTGCSAGPTRADTQSEAQHASRAAQAAELSRLAAQPRPDLWAAAAREWDTIGRPFESSYARCSAAPKPHGPPVTARWPTGCCRGQARTRATTSRLRGGHPRDSRDHGGHGRATGVNRGNADPLCRVTAGPSSLSRITAAPGRVAPPTRPRGRESHGSTDAWRRRSPVATDRICSRIPRGRRPGLMPPERVRTGGPRAWQAAQCGQSQQWDTPS